MHALATKAATQNDPPIKFYSNTTTNNQLASYTKSSLFSAAALLEAGGLLSDIEGLTGVKVNLAVGEVYIGLT